MRRCSSYFLEALFLSFNVPSLLPLAFEVSFGNTILGDIGSFDFESSVSFGNALELVSFTTGGLELMGSTSESDFPTADFCERPRKPVVSSNLDTTVSIASSVGLGFLWLAVDTIQDLVGNYGIQTKSLTIKQPFEKL